MPRIKKNIKNNNESENLIKINNNIKEVKYIVNCADIHIKNDQSNREEYNIVFERFYQSLKKIKNIENTIIVICGDIFDNKTNLKPESIELLNDFFYNLANITDVIMILGNHDQNSNNSNSLDAITPIIKKGFNSKYSVHLLKSGIYEYANILFGVTDIHQDKVTLFNLDTDKTKVNLYHGYIHGAKLQNDITHMVGKFNQTDFKDGDITLLGDIHKFQYLNKNKTMAYPGSLIQMNYGEELYNHGYILWNIEDKTSNYVKILNDYVYYTIEINNGKLITEIDKELPKNLKLRVLYKDTLYEKREEIINELRTKYNIVQLDEIKQMKGLELGDNKKIQQITSINNVNDLIIKYIKDLDEDKKLTEEKIKEVSDELNIITKKIDYNFDKTKKKIKIKKLEFNNMFIYGENNVINFMNLNKIVGLVAENKRGKTSLIDCILFSIWSESDRTISNVDVMKFGTKKMSSTVILSINDINYKIYRQSYQSKGRLYNEVHLYEIDKETNEDKIITEQDKKKTEEKILQIFGTPEEFTLLSIITQDNPINFLTMKDTDKKALLNKMFNLEIIKDINREVNKEHLALTKINKEYDNINKENNIDTIVTTIEKINKEKKELNEKYVKKAEERDKIKKELTVEEYKFNELNKQVEEINNIEEILFQEEKFKKDNEKNKKLLLEYNESIKEIDEEYTNNKKRLEEMGEMDAKYKIWKREKKDKLNELNKEYQELTEQKKPLRELTKQEKKDKKEKEEIINKLENEREDKEQNYEEYEEYNLIDEYNNKMEEKDKEENKKEEFEKELLNFKKNLKKIEEHKFNKNCEACMSNSITKQKVYYEEEINKLENIIQETDNKITELDTFINKKKKKYDKLSISKELGEEINIINDKISQNKKEMKELIKIEKEYNKNILYNEEINKKIEENREQFNKLENEQNDEYNTYKELKEKLNEQNIELIEIREKISILETKIEKNINKLNEIAIISSKYNKNKKIYEEIENTKNILEKNKEKEGIIDNECKELVSKLGLINKEFNKLDTSIQIIQKNKELITKNNKKKEILSIIKGATDSGGILDSILTTNIIPAIENIVNDILMNIDTYKIKISYDSNIKITKIENNTEMESSGLMASGHEKSVLNIIFRLALSKLNSIISTNFFIIDEAFKNSDANKKQKLKTLFEYLRNNYDWVLIVTHDDYIKDNFDKEINIEHQKGTSIIKFN